MLSFDEAVADFLAQKRIAVAGVSRSGGAAANFVFRKLRAAGHDVFPVNPAASEVEGGPCYQDLASIPGGVTAVVVMTPPHVAESVVRECARLGITRVWLHRSIGAGSASDAAVSAAREAKITLIPAGCPAMFSEPVDLAHKCFRWCLRLTGRLPAQVEDVRTEHAPM
jgi:predicted CoA-binding protein